MDIDITEFFTKAAPMDYRASVAEIGASAGADTWRAACDDAPDWNMLDDDDDKLAAMRGWIKSSGGWSDEPDRVWASEELNALFIQLVSGDMREANLDCDEPDWAAYGADENAGRIYRGDDGQVYYYLGD